VRSGGASRDGESGRAGALRRGVASISAGRVILMRGCNGAGARVAASADRGGDERCAASSIGEAPRDAGAGSKGDGALDGFGACGIGGRVPGRERRRGGDGGGVVESRRRRIVLRGGDVGDGGGATGVVRDESSAPDGGGEVEVAGFEFAIRGVGSDAGRARCVAVGG